MSLSALCSLLSYPWWVETKTKTGKEPTKQGLRNKLNVKLNGSMEVIGKGIGNWKKYRNEKEFSHSERENNEGYESSRNIEKMERRGRGNTNLIQIPEYENSSFKVFATSMSSGPKCNHKEFGVQSKFVYSTEEECLICYKPGQLTIVDKGLTWPLWSNICIWPP